MNGTEPTTGMTALDWGVIGAYGVGMLAIGWYYSHRNTTTEEYLLGGRNMRSSSIGLSLFATLFSTITYLALPGEMIAFGPIILWWMAALPLVYVVVGYLLIPHFMRLRVTSAYQILEDRLGVGVRLIGSCIFLATRLLWMGLIIYITADKLIVVTFGLDPAYTPYIAVAIGVFTLVYTFMGGFRAVVLTDAIQSLVLLAGAALSVVMATYRLGGVGAWWPREWQPHWAPQKFFGGDFTGRTILGSLLFMTVWWMCTSGSDQMAIQRYLATRDARAARKAFLITLVSNFVVTTFLAALGFALFSYYRAHPPAGLSLTDPKSADRLFPYFIVHALPPGVTGLVIAGILAAAMSSLSSGLNSSASVIMEDFVNRFRRRAGTPAQQVRQTQMMCVLTGIAAVLLAIPIAWIARSNIMDATVRTNHVFVGPLFGLFFMAMFVPFATPLGTAAGVLAGCAVGVLIGYWNFITGGPVLSFQWIALPSLVVHLVAGCAVSLLQGGRRRERASRIPPAAEVEPGGFPAVTEEREVGSEK